MRHQKKSFAAMSLAGVLAGLAGISVARAENADVTYKAELSPLNSKTTGSDASGEATFTISGDKLTIRITAKGVPPNMEHLQHFHGFAKGDRTSECPTARNDKNGDGIIDIVETEPVAGTTMVPFDADPIGMSAVNDTFPRAGGDGSFSYEKTVSFKALEAAFTKKFPGQQLDLDRRVVFLHGIPASTKLPATVASLDHIPAQVVLPIACGAIKKVRD
ncbi:MAG: hypothetical protein ACREDL_22125 [Bradyrhizobium sp.]